VKHQAAFSGIELHCGFFDMLLNIFWYTEWEKLSVQIEISTYLSG
jgi:hypothetical protein